MVQFWSIKMATAESKPKIVAAPTAKILNLPSPIITFKGRVNGRVETPTCTEWIGQLETYFITEGISNETLKISEAKRFIDPENGDARNIITLPHIKELVNWADFKNAMLELYRGKGEEDPHQALLNLIECPWKINDNLLSYVTKLEALASKYELSHLANCNRVVPKEFARSIIWSKIYKRMPEVKREIIMKKVDTRRDVTKQLLELLKDELIKSPPSTVQTIEDDKDKEPRFDKFRNERNIPRSQKQKNSEETEKFRRPIKEPRCYNCRQQGHIAKRCPETQRCYNCRNHGHLARDCKDDALFRAGWY